MTTLRAIWDVLRCGKALGPVCIIRTGRPWPYQRWCAARDMADRMPRWMWGRLAR